MTTRNEPLCQLLESLKEECDEWVLDGQPLDEELVRRGLFLASMDILYAELFEPGGYESYQRLPERVLLPREEYDRFRQALDFHVIWFKNLSVTLRAEAMTVNGITRDEAAALILERATETFSETASKA